MLKAIQQPVFAHNDDFAEAVVVEIGNGRSGTAGPVYRRHDVHLGGARRAVDHVQVGRFHPVGHDIRYAVFIHIPGNKRGISARLGCGLPLNTQRNLSAGRDIVTIGVAGGVVKIGALPRAGTIRIVTVDQSVAVVVDAIGTVFCLCLGIKQERGEEDKKEKGFSPQQCVLF